MPPQITARKRITEESGSSKLSKKTETTASNGRRRHENRRLRHQQTAKDAAISSRREVAREAPNNISQGINPNIDFSYNSCGEYISIVSKF